MCQLGSWESSYSFLPTIAGRNPLLILVLDRKLKYDVCLDSFCTAWRPTSHNPFLGIIAHLEIWNLTGVAVHAGWLVVWPWLPVVSEHLFYLTISFPWVTPGDVIFFAWIIAFSQWIFFPHTFEGFPWALLIPIPPSCHPFSLAHLELVQVCPSANRPYSGLLSTFSSLQACGLPWRAGCKIRECLAASKC